MKKRTVILCMLALCSFSGYAQEKEISEKQKEFIYKFSYEMNKNIFKSKRNAYKKRKLNLDSLFIRSTNSNETMLSSIDSLEKNASIKVETERYGNNIILESKFPSYFDEESITKVVSIEVHKSYLLNEGNDTIQLRKGGGTSFNTHLNYRYVNGKETNLNYRTVHRQSQVANDSLVSASISGHIMYEVKFITDYVYHEITKKDVGKRMKSGETTFELIDVYDNKIILQILNNQQFILVEINTINVDTSGKHELAPYSYFELEELKKKDSTYKDIELFSRGKMTVPKEIYELFKGQPDITLEEYKKLFPLKKLQTNATTSQQYIIIETAAPIQNKLIIYSPIYGIKKQIKVTLK